MGEDIPRRGNSMSMNSEEEIKASSPFLIELEGSLRKAMEDNWTGRLELDCVVS